MNGVIIKQTVCNIFFMLQILMPFYHQYFFLGSRRRSLFEIKLKMITNVVKTSTTCAHILQRQKKESV